MGWFTRHFSICEWIRYIDNICYIKNQHDKVVMKFDVPKISQIERENRKELNNLLDEVFGYYGKEMPKL